MPNHCWQHDILAECFKAFVPNWWCPCMTDSLRFQSSYFTTRIPCKWWHFYHDLMKDWCLGIRQEVLVGCVKSGYGTIYGKITAGCATLISMAKSLPFLDKWCVKLKLNNGNWTQVDPAWVLLSISLVHIWETGPDSAEALLPSSFSFLLAFPGK